MQRVIERLPFSLRQRWCDVADDITNNKHREITFEDIASFVESKARAFNHPVYGAINTERRNQGKTSNDRRPRRSDNFATQGGEPISENNENCCDITKAVPKCHLCKEDHWLTCVAIQEAVHGTETNVRVQTRTLRELLPTWP